MICHLGGKIKLTAAGNREREREREEWMEKRGDSNRYASQSRHGRQRQIVDPPRHASAIRMHTATPDLVTWWLNR